MREHVPTLDQHPPIMDYEDACHGPIVAMNMPKATQIPPPEHYDSRPNIVVESDGIVDIASMGSRSHIKRVNTD